MYKVSKEVRSFQGEINISGSKSESNRLLVIRAYTSFFKIINISDSDDTNTMISALKSNDKEINRKTVRKGMVMVKSKDLINQNLCWHLWKVQQWKYSRRVD